jgi:pantoate--beta-alanine ligase
MDVHESIEDLRAGLRSRPHPVVLVPTMGALHEGHLSLVRVARERAGAAGTVVVSIFVNPSQFAPHEDFDAYPRPLLQDLDLCRSVGVDVVFAPAREVMYAPDASVRVLEEQLSQGLCGRSRPHFFSGVCTVVAKLFHIVQPEAAVFGEKDFQQLAVIRRMVRDLVWPIDIIAAPIVRESDGLAMSSRNQYLDAESRRQAVVLHQALQRAREAVLGGERNPQALREQVVAEIQGAPLARIDYVEVVDPDALTPLPSIANQVLIALAVRFGSTRLIDNLCLRKLPA